jgi:hypothetical protein
MLTPCFLRATPCNPCNPCSLRAPFLKRYSRYGSRFLLYKSVFVDSSMHN